MITLLCAYHLFRCFKREGHHGDVGHIFGIHSTSFYSTPAGRNVEPPRSMCLHVCRLADSRPDTALGTDELWANSRLGSERQQWFSRDETALCP